MRRQLDAKAQLGALQWGKQLHPAGSGEIPVRQRSIAVAVPGNAPCVARVGRHGEDCANEIRMHGVAVAYLDGTAGHDLDLNNLWYLVRTIPEIMEVSIGHALVSEALYLGLEKTIQLYLQQLR